MYKDVASRFHAANHPDVRKEKYDPNNLRVMQRILNAANHGKELIDCKMFHHLVKYTLSAAVKTTPSSKT